MKEKSELKLELEQSLQECTRLYKELQKFINTKPLDPWKDIEPTSMVEMGAAQKAFDDCEQYRKKLWNEYFGL